MTIIRYCERETDQIEEVAVYDVMTSTMLHQLKASGLQIVETISSLP